MRLVIIFSAASVAFFIATIRDTCSLAAACKKAVKNAVLNESGISSTSSSSAEGSKMYCETALAACSPPPSGRLIGNSCSVATFCRAELRNWVVTTCSSSILPPMNFAMKSEAIGSVSS